MCWYLFLLHLGDFALILRFSRTPQFISLSPFISMSSLYFLESYIAIATITLSLALMNHHCSFHYVPSGDLCSFCTSFGILPNNFHLINLTFASISLLPFSLFSLRDHLLEQASVLRSDCLSVCQLRVYCCYCVVQCFRHCTTFGFESNVPWWLQLRVNPLPYALYSVLVFPLEIFVPGDCYHRSPALIKWFLRADRSFLTKTLKSFSEFPIYLHRKHSKYSSWPMTIQVAFPMQMRLQQAVRVPSPRQFP